MSKFELKAGVCALLSKCTARRLVLFCCLLAAGEARAQEAGVSVYVRDDSDYTTVIAPRLRVATPIGDATRLDLVYGMDIWTSASIDIRASASKPDNSAAGTESITEQRDELDIHLGQDVGELTLNGSYRYSKEPDYESHGGTLGFSRDFADKSATLALDATGTFDRVGRAGDPWFERTARNLSARLSFTQILDQQSLLQVIYVISRADGFLSSPYRFIGIGTPNGYCRDKLMSCNPETNPTQRLRHAFALRGRRALGEHFSVGLGYRFYLDDWQLSSHTAMADLAWLPNRETTLALRYRFYLQSAASQYRAHYESTTLKFYTNDKELSPFSSHRLALDLERSFLLEEPSKRLRVMLSVARSLYLFSDFVALSQITATEVTLATVFQL